MLLRNFKSPSDEIAKRNLANELLQVEINNASIYDERLGKYQDKNAPPPVPPQYKSQDDILRDTIKLERDAIDGIMDIGFSYSDASQIVSKVGQGEQLIQLVQGLPFIKGDILKKFNPKLISTSFFEGYLQNYFDEIGVSFGFQFDRAGGMDVANLSEIKQILPQKDAVEGLIQLITTLPMASDIQDEILRQLQNYTYVALTPAEEMKLNTGEMTARTRQGLFKRIKDVIVKASIPAPIEISQASQMLIRSRDKGDTEPLFNQLGVSLANRVSGMTKTKLKPLESIRNDINIEVPSQEGGIEEITLGIDEDEDLEPSDFKLPTLSQEEMMDYLKNVDDVIKSSGDEYEIRGVMEKAVRNVLKAFPDITDNINESPLNPDTLKKEKSKGFKKTGKEFSTETSELIREFINLMRDTINTQNTTAKKTIQKYIPKAHKYYEREEGKDADGRAYRVGFGVKSKTATNHFVREVDSSSDEEVKKVVKKKSKKPLGSDPATYTPEKAIGAGYIHKRIPIKKIVGKGIEVEEQPTYRTFGKYVMHIPHLTEKNVLNIKYPSLGSIPTIKPMTISEDYKDFIIDVMNTSRVNDKAFNALSNHEQKHFERITKGAGLIDTFKLKRSGDDEERKEVDRFNLLRGNYLGGNNSDDVVKELKGLVVKFINDGRIARQEGLNLLMELSI